MTVQTPPIYLQAGSHPAERVRRAHSSIMGHRPGVVDLSDFAVTQNGTPNMSVNVAAGMAWVLGTESTTQGLYCVESTGTVNLAISASNPSNPRIDLVVLQVRDAAYSGSSNDARLFVVTGTPAGSPVEPAPPANSLVLARVSVGAGVTSITNANITDRRFTPSLYSGNLGGSAAGLGGVIVCTSTTRPQSPRDGQVIYESNTGETLQFYAAASAWRRPWNLPWGQQAIAENFGLSAASIGSSWSSSGVAVTWTAIPNRRYKVEVSWSVRVNTAGTAVYIGLFTPGGTHIATTNCTYVNSATEVFSIGTGQWHFTSSLSGSQTVQLRGLVTAGLMDFQAGTQNPNRLVVMDVGPLSTPA